MSERRASDSMRNALLAVCALALCINGFFMFRLDSKTDKYIEYGRYQSETERLSIAVHNLWNNEQTTLAYVAAMRGDIKRLLDVETDAKTREVLESMLRNELALMRLGDKP